MISNARRARAGVFLILLSACGCGAYLHDDSFQQKATSAKTTFDKIDLTSKFDEQFTRVTSYDNDEDHAVAQLQVASRNQQLQDFIQLPGWYDKTKCSAQNPPICSGPSALKHHVRDELRRLTGHDDLSVDQGDVFRKAPFLTAYDRFALDNDRATLASDQKAFLAAGGDKSSATCPDPAPQRDWPPQPLNPSLDDNLKLIQYWCGDIAAIKRDQELPALKAQVAGGSELDKVLKDRNKALDDQQADQEAADKMKKRIDDITSSSGNPATHADDLRSTLTTLQHDLKNASPVAKYFGYKALADQLQSFLSAEISQTAKQAQNSVDHPLQSSVSSAVSKISQKTGTQTSAAATPKTTQAQAAIDLAMGTVSLVDIYAGQGSYDRVNSLLLATAGARHQMDMAKLDADYQADKIKIYDAEINALTREVSHLYNASFALGSGDLNARSTRQRQG